MVVALTSHWPEYFMEGAELGLFMVSISFFAVLFKFPASPVRDALPMPAAQNLLMGMSMGLTAVGLIYSPWGKQSGAHFNPAVTLTFLRLGKVMPWDAAFYIAAQFAGAASGVWLSALVFGNLLADPAIHYVTTDPGPAGGDVAFLAEFAMSLGYMMMVLIATNTPTVASYTGLFAGTLVAIFTTLGSPASGAAMNPARAFASAARADDWAALWIYMTAPTLGMLAAAQTYLAWKGPQRIRSAKLHHDNDRRCIFLCDFHGTPEPAAARAGFYAPRPQEPADAATTRTSM